MTCSGTEIPPEMDVIPSHGDTEKWERLMRFFSLPGTAQGTSHFCHGRIKDEICSRKSFSSPALALLQSCWAHSELPTALHLTPELLSSASAGAGTPTSSWGYVKEVFLPLGISFIPLNLPQSLHSKKGLCTKNASHQNLACLQI